MAEESTSSEVGLTALAWSGTVAVNLVVPLPLGLLATHGDAQLGLGLGVMACWAVGLGVCLNAPRVGEVLMQGGAWVCLLQMCPVLQIAAGLAGLWLWKAMSGHGSLGHVGPAAAAGGFVVTSATALCLLAAAFLFGGGLRLLRATPATEQAADFGEAVPRPAEDV